MSPKTKTPETLHMLTALSDPSEGKHGKHSNMQICMFCLDMDFCESYETCATCLQDDSMTSHAVNQSRTE